jgi:hypothetical protein
MLENYTFLTLRHEAREANVYERPNGWFLKAFSNIGKNPDVGIQKRIPGIVPAIESFVWACGSAHCLHTMRATRNVFHGRVSKRLNDRPSVAILRMPGMERELISEFARDLMA